ncbi:MAG: thiamine phosphate synthase [Alloprevotella sp.]|nr:thiamine phosphate synthase [Alloprevotella sp.]
MDRRRFKLQLITHPRESLSVAQGAHMALKGGCRWIQLRHKDAPVDTIIEEARAICDGINRETFTFILDDHVNLVEVVGADGVHLGKNDMPVAEARHALGPAKIIGATANTLDDIIAAAEAGADYIGLGPFRFTSTKERLSPTLGLDGYRNIIGEARRRGIRLPIVAIGGITEADIPAIMAAGADGIAISGTILSAPSPALKTKEIISII